MEADRYIIYKPATDLYWHSRVMGEVVWVEDPSDVPRIQERDATAFIEMKTIDDFIGCVYVKIVDDVPDYTHTLNVKGPS